MYLSQQFLIAYNKINNTIKKNLIKQINNLTN